MSDDEKQFLFRLDERVDAFGERLATLEGKLEKEKAKGMRKRLSEYGGVLALILSIVIGAFTVYDKVIRQPEEDEVVAFESFREDIGDLGKLTAQIASLDWKGNYEAAQAQAGSLTPLKVELIEKIEHYGEMHPDKLKFADRMMLANENVLFMWHEKAIVHAKKALEISADSQQAANAYWAIARMSGNLNKLPEMRFNFEKARNEFEVMGLKSSGFQMLQMFSQWVYYELIQNQSCDPAKDVFDAMKVLYSNPAVWPATKAATRNGFQNMLSGVPKTCDLELH